MKKFLKISRVAIFLPFFMLVKANANEIISNFGRTGLLVNPTAYTIKDGHLSFGSSYVYPYFRVYGNVGFFPGLELGGTITEIRDIYINSGRWQGYGYYKDKAFFAKYQILPETDKFPAIAVGWDDFHGTKLFETKYFVVTKYIDTGLPQNVTIGYAKGVLDGFFFGSETLLHPKLSFIFEYSPLKEEKLKGISNIKSKYNFGLKFQPLSWLQTVVSYQRGKEVGVNVSIDIPMGKPWLPHKPKYFLLTKEDVKLIKENKQTTFFEKALERLDLRYPKVYISGNALVIEYSNEGYFYETVALKKVLSIFKVVYFPKVKNVKIVLKEKNIPVTEVTIPGYLINEYLTGKVDIKTLLNDATYSIAPNYRPLNDQIFSSPSFKGSLKLRTFLNDPSGAFKYKLSYDVGVKEYFLDNFIFQGLVVLPLKNNISSVNSPLMEKPVRSDIDDYLDNNHPDVSVLSVSYVSPLFSKTFIGVSAGYNELMFAGIGGDLIHFIGDGRFAVGVGGDWVRKRDSERIFKLKNYSFYDAYLSAHYTMKYPEMNFSVKAGRFLAGDKGVRVEVSRVVKGFEVGFWYTYSDTSNFTGSNKDYHDKGVFVSIPLRMFKWKDTRQVGFYSLSPWTRDVGQLAGRPIDLYRMMQKKMPFYLRDKSEERE
ncbi:YjbH domain-containing protein [Desulfurobacterium thermolithotrophum]|uniref:YjbH domain-containing protein n=1 Tax=Desulfurobacterium thermolithotrophum TaxID=64160 RepID=UPI0013D61837|nr:YjbH domain-containing protein [Desulfurobacterium thermolithotrophum]